MAAYSSQDGEHAILMTFGNANAGAREMTVFDVEPELIDVTADLLMRINMWLCYDRHMPDEGTKAYLGIYNEKGTRLCYSWTPFRPDVQDAGTFAEPVIYLTAADIRNGRGKKLGELTAEDFDSLTYRQPYKEGLNEEMKARETFPKAFEYFKGHPKDSSIVIGVRVRLEGEEYNETDGYDPQGDYGYVYTSPAPDGTLTVLDDNEEAGIKRGDVLTLDPSAVFFWRLDKEEGSYFTDDLYLL